MARNGFRLRCTAHTTEGSPCNNWAMNGRVVCRKHGGNAPRGAASPQFQGRGFSAYLPERLRDRYEEAASDPRLLDMRHGIALLDTRISSLLENLDTGESGKRMKAIKEAYYDLRKAMASADKQKTSEALEWLEIKIHQAAQEYEAWEEIRVVLSERRKLSTAEHRRLVDMQQMITAERAMTLVASIVASIERHVTDPAALEAIAHEIGGLLTIEHREKETPRLL